ncbi:MAG: DUF4338 domain-containing protein [Desulfobulbaceae bacterium]|nr:DUF4338 domain-containing protein [Desulfobulbaceae bacterium]
MLRYSGREFTTDELEQIRNLIKNNPGFNRSRLFREVCEMFIWLKPDGKLREMSCRVAMLRMHEDGTIQLPPPTHWEKKYNIRPVLLESFVESKRFAGTCYKAAKWTFYRSHAPAWER